jgi:1-deoxy-D-xylulose-5-phosphate reductoisomerase
VTANRPVGLAVLGSTGSVGRQALDVVRANPGHFRVVALAAGRDATALAAQAAEFGVPAVDARCCGNDAGALAALAAHIDADIVLNAVVGFAGLPATIAALESGKRLALANKESLIAGGPVVRAVRARGGGEIVPVDSEHSAVYQALQAGPRDRLRRILLTASGGPFRGRSRAELAHVSVADALAHPTWSMGPKITIDSSTLMNKGLEVIEAHELFDADLAQVEVVVHPQSVVHGMVEFTDGATIAQLSMPDMRLPIAYALAAPNRVEQPVGVTHVRGPRRRRVPVPGAGVRSGPPGRHRPRRTERCQRDRGGGLPRRPDRMAPDRRRDRRSSRDGRRRERARRGRRCGGRRAGPRTRP